VEEKDVAVKEPDARRSLEVVNSTIYGNICTFMSSGLYSYYGTDDKSPNDKL